MTPITRRLAAICLAGLASNALSNVAGAHSASDAYLTLSAEALGKEKHRLLHGQWDIAIRDLDFALKLDDDGDGRVTWGEVKKHQAAIEAYVYRYLHVTGGSSGACSVRPVRLMIDDHADGAYAALFFDALCPAAARKLSLQYTLFFLIDPSHRGIFVMNEGTEVSTGLLSPENSSIDLVL